MKRYIVIFDLYKPTIWPSWGSDFVKYVKKNFGLIAREFGDERSAMIYAKHFLASKGFYTTTTEDTQLAWSNPPFDIRLKKCDAVDIKYLLFVSENGIDTHAYECDSRYAAIKQAAKILDKKDLEPTEEENINGYWSGISYTGVKMAIELRMAINGEQYLNIDPCEMLTNKEKELFLRATVETVNERQLIIMIILQVIFLLLSVAFFINVKIIENVDLGYLPDIFVTASVAGLIRLLLKLRRS